jgi:hypothetical protein
MGVCIGCLFSAGVAGTMWGTGKVLEWHAEWSRRRAMAEVDRTTPCRGRAGAADLATPEDVPTSALPEPAG